ncbi:hypothetical protein GMES_1319 [Paraglaciecola mesophila KMM 241]|uniref:Uncharacterized protein n=1 Tax=Paraglaciecola mesophila KMM 241 TaxID=1128912 RepID=K6Z3N7_9ALTE|nr:hypothetical protein GMES_1319 [Paraglaciecola mesophila KMM 241]
MGHNVCSLLEMARLASGLRLNSATAKERAYKNDAKEINHAIK